MSSGNTNCSIKAWNIPLGVTAFSCFFISPLSKGVLIGLPIVSISKELIPFKPKAAEAFTTPIPNSTPGKDIKSEWLVTIWCTF